MINYSIWNFIKFKKLTDLLDTIESNKLTHREFRRGHCCLNLNNEITDVYRYDGDGIEGTCSILYSNENLKYIRFKVNAQSSKKNTEIDEYYVVDNEVEAISFEINNVVKVIVLASQRKAETIISRIFKKQEVWGNIEPDNYITEDMLYWLFYRLRERNDEMITKNPKMFLNGIVSYLGRTNDKINAVRGIGVRVSALLGTLGMLLGEENLRALRPIIQYEDHEINVELYIGNTGKLYETTYKGQITDDNDFANFKLVLLVCRYILPTIQKGYKESCTGNEWSIYIKQTFLRGIGNEMADKVKKELARIDLEMKKFAEDNEIIDDLEEDSEQAEIEDEIIDTDELEEDMEQ